MPIVSIVFGLLLVGVGGWGYSVAEVKSWTAWIPAIVGGPLVVAGALALNEKFLKHAMHAAAMVGVLGTLAGIGGVGRLLALGKSLGDNPGIASLAMLGLSAVFVGLCVNSFIQVRRRRAAQQPPA